MPLPPAASPRLKGLTRGAGKGQASVSSLSGTKHADLLSCGRFSLPGAETLR